MYLHCIVYKNPMYHIVFPLIKPTICSIFVVPRTKTIFTFLEFIFWRTSNLVNYVQHDSCLYVIFLCVRNSSASLDYTKILCIEGAPFLPILCGFVVFFFHSFGLSEKSNKKNDTEVGAQSYAK